MMKKKIAVIGATGRQGVCLVNEAVSRGHEVTAFVRDGGKAVNAKAKKAVKDIFALTPADLKGFDAVIDAFGAWTPDTLPLHTTTLLHLCDCLKNTKTRLLVVGGAGTLYVDKAHTLQLMHSEGFPDIYKPVAEATGEAFEALKKYSGVSWTYLSPAADFQADGKRTGTYTLGGDELIVNSKGESAVSYADYAIAMIDEAENAKFIGKRFTVVSG